MKTYNTYYKDFNSLCDFIKSNAIPNSSRILIKIFTSRCHADFITDLTRGLLQLLPQAKILGATTKGEILDGQVLNNAAVMSFLIFECTEVKTSIIQTEGSHFQLGVRLAEELKINEAKVIFAFTTPDIEGEVFLKGIEGIGSFVPLMGGKAGDGINEQESMVFTENGIVTSGAVGAVLTGSELNIVSDYSFSWEPIGKYMTVTKTESSRVHSIDDTGLLDVYRKYLGDEVAGNLPFSASEFPLLIQKGDVLVARVLQEDYKDGSFGFSAGINTGDIVRFGYGNIDNIMKRTKNIVDRLKNFPIQAIFLYSCFCRKIYLNEMVEEETLPYRNVAPVTGLFTLGEYFCLGKSLLFLNITMLIIGIYEGKGEFFYKEPEYKNNKKQNSIQKNSIGIRALTHLINVVVGELNEINESLESKNKEILETLGKLKDTQQQLIESEKMSALGLLVAGVAHEINTPVGIGITASSHLVEKVKDIGQLYQKGVLGKADFEEFIDTIDKTSKILLSNLIRAGELIKGFKQVAVDQSSEDKRWFNLKQYINEVLTNLMPEIKKGKHKVSVCCPDNLELESYPGGFSHIITNFVMNSLKYAFDNDSIGHMRFEAKIEEGSLVFKYSDNGAGIPKENINKIFDPFFTTQRDKGSTGLGLHIVYNIVTQQLKGTIVCKSKLGEGVLFEIKVPLANAAGVL
ncbi:MAG: ATP-binding protein [Clostridia bacterium]|nr:ATP-binding protein [Clostridia bacterium]